MNASPIARFVRRSWTRTNVAPTAFNTFIHVTQCHSIGLNSSMSIPTVVLFTTSSNKQLHPSLMASEAFVVDKPGTVVTDSRLTRRFFSFHTLFAVKTKRRYEACLRIIRHRATRNRDTFLSSVLNVVETRRHRTDGSQSTSRGDACI